MSHYQIWLAALRECTYKNNPKQNILIWSEHIYNLTGLFLNISVFNGTFFVCVCPDIFVVLGDKLCQKSGPKQNVFCQIHECFQTTFLHTVNSTSV